MNLKRPVIRVILFIGTVAGVLGLFWIFKQAPAGESGREALNRRSLGSGRRAANAMSDPGGGPGRHSAPLRESKDSKPPDLIMKAFSADWENPEKAGPLMAALVDWARSDTDACLKWLSEQTPELSQRLIHESAGALMKDSPIAAFQLLNELPSTPKTDEMLRQSAMQLASADLSAAIEWAGLQTDDAARQLLWSAICTAMAETGPEGASRAAFENLQDPALRDRVVVEIVQRWVQKDIQAAAAFVLTLDGTAGISAANAVSAYWTRLDPRGCESWILSIGSPDLRSSAFSAFVEDLSRNDRLRLQQLAEQLEDPGLLTILHDALERR